MREVTCADLELALATDDPALREALARHAEGCAACQAELTLAREIEAAAPSLRKAWASPGLDERVRQSWRAEARTRRPLRAASWVSLAAAALLVVGLGVRAWKGAPAPDAGEAALAFPALDPATQQLLSEQAAAEVEKAEAAYVRSVDALARLAEPRLQEPLSPALTNYREKLLLLDTAIAACRAEVERNRFNAQLRLELLSLYREKRDTLDTLLKEDLNAL